MYENNTVLHKYNSIYIWMVPEYVFGVNYLITSVQQET